MSIFVSMGRGADGDPFMAELDFDAEADCFVGAVTVPRGHIAIRGRSLDELRADFREGLTAQRAALAEAGVEYATRG